MADTNIISINQLVGMFKDFSQSHLQINDFGYGPTSEIGVNRQAKYPLLWITHRGTSDINVTNKTQIPEMNLSFIIVDRINLQENYGGNMGLNGDNSQEVLSDTFQITQDLVNFVSTTMGQFGVQLTEDGLSTEPLFDETQDKVSGWITDMALRLKHVNCVTPMGDVDITIPSQSNISLRYLTCDTLTGCTSFKDLREELIDLVESGTTSSLWSENVNGIHYDSGNVGIGTNTSSVNTKLEINYDDTTERALRIKNTDSNSQYNFRGELRDSEHLLRFDSDNTGITPLVLSSVNKVGVGIPNIIAPQATLHVYSTSSSQPIVLVEDETNPDATPFIIDSDGNVGLGTDTPTEKLDIVGNTKISGTITASGIPSYADDTDAGVGGLTTGEVYQTDGTGASPLNVVGILMIKQ